MKKNLHDLAKMLKQANSASFSFKYKVEFGLYLIERLAYNSPVDTSALISNWQLTTTPLKSAIRQPFHVGSKGSTRQASINAVIAHNRQAAGRFQKHQRLYVVNKVPYAEIQNLKHKELKGFIEKSILEAKIKFGVN